MSATSGNIYYSRGNHDTGISDENEAHRLSNNAFSGPNHSLHFHFQSQMSDQSRLCYLCWNNIPFATLIPLSGSSQNQGLTVCDLVEGLVRFFKVAEFQKDVCNACVGIGKLTRFLTSLQELERSITEVKGHVEAQSNKFKEFVAPPIRGGLQAATVQVSVSMTDGTKPFSTNVFESVYQEITMPTYDNDDSFDVNPGEPDELPVPEPQENHNLCDQTKNSKNSTTRKRAKTTLRPRKKTSRSSVETTSTSEYICNVCNKSFKTEARLSSHFLIHSGEKPFECKECGKAFRHNPALFLHMKRHTGERKYKCTTCDSAFYTKYQLTEHERNHTKERPHKCPHCDLTCSRVYFITQHIRRHHPDKAKAKNLKPRLQCPSCPKSFLNPNELQRHEINSHRSEDDKMACCDICGKKYADNKSAKRHVREVHEGKRSNKPRIKCHQCVTCGVLFDCLSRLELHSRSHVPKEDRVKFPCSQCPKTFFSKINASLHEKKHELGKVAISKPKQKKPSRKQAKLIKECRSQDAKILLSRVDIAPEVAGRLRQRLARRAKLIQNSFNYGEVEQDSQSNTSWANTDSNIDSNTTLEGLKAEVVDGLVKEESFSGELETDQIPEGAIQYKFEIVK